MSSTPCPWRTLAALALALLCSPDARATTLPSGFQESIAFYGLEYPTAVAFANDGRVFVAEKSGLVKVFDSLADTTPTVFADLRTNTHNFWDRGLLGLALHPSFPTVPYVYVLYTLDAAVGGTPPRWGSFGGSSDSCPSPPGDTDDGCVVAGRVSRLTAAGDVAIGGEQVLVENWCQQYPSHSIGTIAFGADGALYVSGGDGASFTFVDYGQKGFPLVNPCDDPPGGAGGAMSLPAAEGGAFRPQDLVTSGDPVGFDGTVIRLDPITGTPMADNPFVGNGVPDDDPVIAYGLRNPFRMTPRPGTNELWIGDVGWLDWEEIDRIGHTGDLAIENFGWPCYEGVGKQPYYGPYASICTTLYGSLGAVTDPVFAYNHAEKVVPNEACGIGSSSITGLAFYEGGAYPTVYDGALFFADYSRSCIWVAPLGPNGEPDMSRRATFASGTFPPVDLVVGPGGDLFYVAGPAGMIMRISYVAASQPPLAVLDADRTDGPTPLTVSFDASGSSDPDPGDTLTYSWDLNGDGTYGDSTLVAPTALYETPGSYDVRLRVTDPHGASATTRETITAGNTKPSPDIAAPTSATTWHAGSTIAFAGSATDAEDGTIAAAGLSWTLVVQHCPSNCHEHTVQTLDGVASGVFTAPQHDYPTYLELRLKATDSGGLTRTTSVAIQPETVDLAIATDPPGLVVAAGTTSAAAPYQKTEIVGSTFTLSAPSPQSLGEVTYAFVSWSDGGARSHDVTPASEAESYVALFEPVSPTPTTTAVVTPTATPSPTVTTTGLPTATPTGTPSTTATPTSTPTTTPTGTTTATASTTATPTATGTLTTTPTPTGTATATPTSTPVPTATSTTTASATPVPTTSATPLAGTGTCDAPFAIPADGGTFAGTTSGASALAGSCAATGTAPEAVYAWTPNASGTAAIQTCDGADTAYDTVLYLRTGSCAGGAELACNDDAPGCFTSEPSPFHASHLAPAVVAGETYYIVVDGYGGASGGFLLSVTAPDAPVGSPTATPSPAPTNTPVPSVTATPPPVVGTCTQPIALPAAGGTFAGQTAGAPSVLGAGCGTSGNAPETVFTWTPAASGVAELATCGAAGTSFDTILSVRPAGCGGPELACNDDAANCGTASGSGHGSRVALSVSAGETYAIVVDGYNGKSGSFTLQLIPPP